MLHDSSVRCEESVPDGRLAELPGRTVGANSTQRAFGSSARIVPSMPPDESQTGHAAITSRREAPGVHCDDRGDVHPGAGWTDVIVTPERGAPSVDGLLTGWHEPEASHLQMLAAIAAPDALQSAYDAAVEARYRWHEFGDVHLIVR